MDFKKCTTISLAISFAIFFPNYICEISYRPVLNCPKSVTTRKERSRFMNCSETRSDLTYHCLLTTWNTFAEFCYNKLAQMARDGCLVLKMRGEDVQIGQIKCTESPECPDKSGARIIYSNEMWKYPGCLRQKRVEQIYISTSSFHRITFVRYSFSAIEETPVPESALVSRNAYDVTTTLDVNASEKPFFWSNVVLFGGTSLAVFLLCLVVVILAQCRRITSLNIQMEAAKYMPSVPYDGERIHVYNEVNEDIYELAVQIDKTNPDVETAGMEHNTMTNEDDENSSLIDDEGYLKPIRSHGDQSCSSEEYDDVIVL